MKCHRLSCLFLLSCFIWGSITSGSAQPAPGTLLGQWQCQYLGETLSLVFQSDSQLVFAGETASYALAPGKFVVSDGFEMVEYRYTLQGDQLVVDLEEGFQMSCARVGKAPATRPQVSEPGAGETRAAVPSAQLSPPRQDRQQASGTISGDEVGDPSWGFKFEAPAGWKWKADHSGAMLGHDTIPGMVLVIPHQEKTLQAVNQQLQQGLTEDDFTLSPSGQISQKGSGLLSCEIKGVAQGQQVRGRAYGTLSPYGGGAYVLSLTTPEKVEEGVVEAADTISSRMSYFKVDSSPLVKNFSGMWAYYSGNSSGGTLINYTFYPDGTFEDSSETSYNINSSGGGWGTPDTNIGATGVQSSRARWTVRGSLESGQIIVTRPDGSRRQIDYQIFVEKGRKYSREFVFNGRHFSKRKDY